MWKKDMKQAWCRKINLKILKKLYYVLLRCPTLVYDVIFGISIEELEEIWLESRFYSQSIWQLEMLSLTKFRVFGGIVFEENIGNSKIFIKWLCKWAAKYLLNAHHRMTKGSTFIFLWIFKSWILKLPRCK